MKEMLENPPDSSSSASFATVKRYAPPNQRNRPLGRRKSGVERLDRVHSSGNDGEKNQIASGRNSSASDHGEAGCSNRTSENPYSGLIPLHGCCNSEAFRLLNDRWSTAMNAYNNPSTDLAERPVLYTGNGPLALGYLKVPHQMNATASSGDFLSKLRHAMRTANPNSDN